MVIGIIGGGVYEQFIFLRQFCTIVSASLFYGIFQQRSGSGIADMAGSIYASGKSGIGFRLGMFHALLRQFFSTVDCRIYCAAKFHP